MKYLFMDAKEKFDQLLADEEFQDEIRNFGNVPKKEQKAVLKKYSITEKEFTYAKRFLSGISFGQKELDSEDVNYALTRLMRRIADASIISSGIERGKKIDFITMISRVAAILSIPLLLSTIYFYQKASNLNSEYFISSSQKRVFNTFQAPPGAKTQVVLPDGSLVWLNSGSSLSCPAIFDAESRNVALKGEAYFEVVKNEEVPMFVSTGHLKVKVYGTKFNVNAFADEGVIETTLVEGKVSIIPGDSKKEYSLNPGYTASYAVKKQKIQMTKVADMDAFIGWREGKLLFHNEHFSDILKKLERWYNVDIQLTDGSLGDYTLYATFFDENIEQVLDIFSNSIPISVEYPKRIKKADGSYSKREIVIARDFSKRIN